MILLAALLACTDAPPAAPEVQPPPAAPVRAILFPGGPGASSPTLVGDDAGVLAAWVEPVAVAVDGVEAQAAGNRVRTARWTPAGWTAVETVVEGPQVVASWADSPAIARAADGSRVVAWLHAVEGDPHATELHVSRAAGEGDRWQVLGAIHKDGVAAEHGFASAVPEAGPDGAGVRVFWLDGRAVPAGGSAQLRTARVTGQLGEESVLDPRVCDCCGTAAVAIGGQAVVAARDRSDGEVRDIQLLRTDGRRTVVAEDGWKIEGCPVNGPALAADDQHLVAAWYTEAQGPQLRVAFSGDGGGSFGASTRVDDGDPVGRAAVAMVDQEAVVGWVAKDGDGATLKLRRVAPDGQLGAVTTVGPTKAGAFPRLAAAGNELLLLSSALDQPGGLRASQLSLDALAAPGAAAPTAAPSDAASPSGTPAALPPLGTPLPASYAARDLDGAPLPLAAWQGQPLLVNLWATWCPPCMQELPALRAMHDVWGPEGLVMVGIAINDETAKVKATAKTRQMGWILGQDASGPAGAAFGTTMLPTTFIYGRDGRLLYAHTGPVEAEDDTLIEAIEAALKR